jgi:hypothetical protein
MGGGYVMASTGKLMEGSREGRRGPASAKGIKGELAIVIDVYISRIKGLLEND